MAGLCTLSDFDFALSLSGFCTPIGCVLHSQWLASGISVAGLCTLIGRILRTPQIFTPVIFFSSSFAPHFRLAQKCVRRRGFAAWRIQCGHFNEVQLPRKPLTRARNQSHHRVSSSSGLPHTACARHQGCHIVDFRLTILGALESSDDSFRLPRMIG